jgi:hypothetical protein
MAAMSVKSLTVPHRAFGRKACGRPDDRRDPEVSTWRDVNCRRCLEAGFVEVVGGAWKVTSIGLSAYA